MQRAWNLISVSDPEFDIYFPQDLAFLSMLPPSVDSFETKKKRDLKLQTMFFVLLNIVLEAFQL